MLCRIRTPTSTVLASNTVHLPPWQATVQGKGTLVTSLVLSGVPIWQVTAAGTGAAGVAKYYDGQSRGGSLPAIPPAFLDVTGIKELQACIVTKGHGNVAIKLGAAVSLTQTICIFDNLAKGWTANDGNRWRAMSDHLKRVANHQVRS